MHPFNFVTATAQALEGLEDHADPIPGERGAPQEPSGQQWFAYMHAAVERRAS